MLKTIKSNKHNIINLDDFDICKYDTYLEPVGSKFEKAMNIYKTKFKGNVILNDIDALLMDMIYNMAKSPIEVYYEICKIHLDLKRANIDNERDVLINKIYESKDIIKITSLEYILRNMCKHKDGYGLSIKKLVTPNLDLKLIMFHSIYERFKFRLCNLDCFNVIDENNNEKTFIYMEPPFSNKFNFNHEKLMSKIISFKGRVVLKYKDSIYIRQLYSSDKFNIIVHGDWLVIVKE